MEFDPTSYMVNGISLLFVVFGLVEFIKTQLNWEGKKVTALSAFLGVLLLVLHQLQTVIPEPYSQIYVMVFTSVAFGLSASGYYKFVSPRLPKRV